MAKKDISIKRAISTYNNLMNDLCYEHLTIGTRYSEDTENWNLRDMVAECDYILSTFYEEGHCNEDLRNSDYIEDRKMWKNYTSRLNRFITNHKPYIKHMKCASGHCSSYDN